MSLLKKENWIINSLLVILSCGAFTPVLGYLMGLFDKDAWYSKMKNWLLGIVLFMVPAFIMLFIFIIQMSAKVAASLGIKGSEVYNTPYTWIALFIIPIVGWVLFIVMYIYLQVFILIKLKEGECEKLLNK